MTAHDLSKLEGCFLLHTRLTLVNESFRASPVNSSWINLQALSRRMHWYVGIGQRYFRYTVNVGKAFKIYYIQDELVYVKILKEI